LHCFWPYKTIYSAYHAQLCVIGAAEGSLHAQKNRKKALNLQQAEQQLNRCDRLLAKWTAELVSVARKIDQYRKKVAYYQARAHHLNEARLAEMREAVRDAEAAAGRNLRSRVAGSADMVTTSSRDSVSTP